MPAINVPHLRIQKQGHFLFDVFKDVFQYKGVSLWL